MNWKKSLCILATMPACAFAQSPAASNVQIYGRLDVGLNYQKFSGESVRRSTLTSDTSLFGFQGTETIGNGLSAYFKLENGFQLDTGALTSSSRLFSREALVGLRDARLGALQLGLQWSPILWLTAATDPFGRSQTGAQITLFQGTGVRGYLVQYQNAVQYISPTFSGFTARLAASAPEGQRDENYGASLTYAQDRVYAALAYDDAQTSGATVGLPALGGTRSKTVALGATYSLDAAKLFGYFQSNRVAGLPTVNGYLVGASVPVGAGEFRASALHTDRQDAPATLVAVGYAHFLSKRTQVYTSAGHLNNKGASRFSMWPGRQDMGTAGVPLAGQDIAGFQVGIRHLF